MGKKKKKKEPEDDKPDDTGVSEYLIRQRLREVAPDAWPVDKCPKCKRDWNTKLDMCKKCNLTQDDARVIYADLLVSKVPAALRIMGNKKSTDIRTLAKKTKSTDYNAGVIAAAMVDTGVTEIVKVGTPLRSFVLNIAGLAFLVITWHAMSLAIIIALYVSRKTQVEKFAADIDDGKKWIPTEEEAAAEDAEDEVAEEVTDEEDAAEAVEEETEDAATEAEEDEAAEEVADEEDIADAVEEETEESPEIQEDEGSQEIADTEDSEIESDADDTDAEEVEATGDESEE